MNRLLLFVVFTVAACAAPLKHVGSDPVTIGDWCGEVGRKLCDTMAARCMNNLAGFADGCRDSFAPACAAGRDGGAGAGRTYDELHACVAHLDGLSCEGLGAGVGSGELHEKCGVR